MTKTLPKSKLVLKFTLILCQSCHNWLTRLALWPNSNGVPGTLLIIHLDLLPPRGHTQAMGARDDGNGGRGPMLASNTHIGAHNNGNGGGGPACDRRLLQRQWKRQCLGRPRSCSGEGDVIQDGYGGGSCGRQRQMLSRARGVVAQETVTRGNMTTIRTIGQSAGQCDKPTEQEGCNERRHWAESQREGGVEAPGKVTTNRTRGARQNVDATD